MSNPNGSGRIWLERVKGSYGSEAKMLGRVFIDLYVLKVLCAWDEHATNIREDINEAMKNLIVEENSEMGLNYVGQRRDIKSFPP